MDYFEASSGREICTASVSNVIYHKFSHGAAFYTLNGKNVNVMLELLLLYAILCQSAENLLFFNKVFPRLVPDSYGYTLLLSS